MDTKRNIFINTGDKLKWENSGANKYRNQLRSDLDHGDPTELQMSILNKQIKIKGLFMQVEYEIMWVFLSVICKV